MRGGQTDTADAVLVLGKDAHADALEDVPHHAVEVVAARKQQTPATGEGHRRDAGRALFGLEHGQLLVCPQVE